MKKIYSYSFFLKEQKSTFCTKMLFSFTVLIQLLRNVIIWKGIPKNTFLTVFMIFCPASSTGFFRCVRNDQWSHLSLVFYLGVWMIWGEAVCSMVLIDLFLWLIVGHLVDGAGCPVFGYTTIHWWVLRCGECCCHFKYPASLVMGTVCRVSELSIADI